MKKTLVAYYSKTGSNRFLALKTAEKLGCDIEEIKPRLNAHLLLIMGVNMGNKKFKKNLSEYDRVILFGPVWMGKLIVPLKNFIIANKTEIKSFVFASCCGSSFEMREKKFGHGIVFKKVQEIMGDKYIHCEAFPITLILPDDKKLDQQAIMSTRLTKENFTGEIEQRFNEFIKKIEE